MGRVDSAVNESLRPTIFDVQPTPIIILSEKSTIVLINRAAQQLFQSSHSLVDAHISSLPIHWQDGSDEALQKLLTDSVNADQPGPDHESEGDTAVLKLQVEVPKHELSSTVTARLLVSNFDLSGENFRTLSFENIKENHDVHVPLQGAESTSSGDSRLIRPSSPEKAASYSGAVPSTATSQGQLEARFKRLVDAIYHNEDRAGFLLSADNSFCYPSYRGGDRNVTPVEIDDIEMFFSNWDVWTPDFTRPEPLSEYPSIWLNREKRKLRRRRYGIKEGGKDIVLEISGDPLYDHQTGEFLGSVSWIQTLGEYEDVVTSDFKASLTDFRAICDRLPHLLWTSDDTGEVDYFSKSWYEFTGLTESQSMGLGFTSAIDEADMQGIWDKFTASKKTQTELIAEAKYRRKDGQWIWHAVRAKPLIDSNGRILKWYGTSTDIQTLVVERREAERKKQQMIEMLSMNEIGLFELSDDRLQVLEGHMTWLADNRTTRLVSELDDSKGHGIPALKRHLKDIQEDKYETALFEGQINSRWYKFRLITDGIEEPEGPETANKVMGCSVDVTEQHERVSLEHENARLVHEASLEMEKSRLKTAFLAHMSHEIRTPIAGIIGTAEILAESKLDGEQEDCINNIQVSANNLLTIVNDILDLSKIEAGKIQFEKTAFDAWTVVTQVKELFKHTAKSKALELKCSRPNQSTSLEMIGDSGRVKQILTNLVSNAIKFTSDGSIDISVSKDCAAKIQIVVQDTGEGIDEETMAMLFKPFVQGDASTARRHGGTGLGLTISRNLAQKMGGALTLESTLSQGTKAVLTLPKEMGFEGLTVKSSDRPHIQQSKSGSVTIRDATAGDVALARPALQRMPSSQSGPAPKSKPSTPQPQSQKQQQGAPSHSQPLVLIVEDNAINQKVALNLVRKLGYKTHAVWNGQEALDYLSACSLPSATTIEKSDPSSIPELDAQTPSAILMDCQMPICDGYEATKLLRTDERYEKVKSVPVIALTASAIQGDREKCQAAGMDDYLSKPVNKALLKGMLERWIPQESSQES
ncbi:hypothetical protein OHC33_006617 [Knufia fluminis]|uniref:histidine kinase n=1 Tax=Knufia fluminis TaxID=191047 RepID=A0AAN8I729_9EURO|nr:hypothetical protein OHC33_006617 [Knufia fluminis]